MPEPVSVAMMKTHLNLEADFTDDDTYIATLISAARRVCELKLNRALVDGARQVVVDAFPAHAQLLPISIVPQIRDPRADELELPGGTIVGVPAITYVDPLGATQQLAADGYILANAATPARIAPIGRWPATAQQPGAIIIDYAVSALDPDDLTLACQAIMLVAGNWYTNREGAVLDVRGIPTELPLAVTWILASLRQWSTS